MSTPIGKKIRTIRDALEMGRQEFADRTEIAKGTLIRIEQGQHEPKANTLIAIAHEWPQFAAYLLTDKIEIKQRRPEVAGPEKKLHRSTKAK